MKKHDYLIVGAGIAGLTAACRLVDAGEKDIAIVEDGYGGTPYIAAFNAVLQENPHGDSAQLYAEDMLHAGYEIGNRELVQKTASLTTEVVDLMERWGVQFTKTEKGYLLRHCSGSTVPRSLCRTDVLVGEAVVHALVPRLKERGVHFYSGCACVSLLSRNQQVYGITVLDKLNQTTYHIFSNKILAAWGGVGRLYADSTYPGDVDGRGVAMAFEVGAALSDLEFVEFEPMVAYEPPEARGEPCPTAMLGEGATLLNEKGERFLLKDRPQGEAGAPKTLINKAIMREVSLGNGTPLGGAYVDLRMIPQETLEAYPWFYERVLNAGKDVKKELLEVGPMAHSHSGGIEIDLQGMSNIKGLFAAGEAASGMHGACRMAGNAATQSAASGILAADGMMALGTDALATADEEVVYHTDLSVRNKYYDEIGQLLMTHVNRERSGEGLKAAADRLTAILQETAEDTLTHQRAQSALLVASAALQRQESRGTHVRVDYPEQRKEYQCSIRLHKDGNKAAFQQIRRD